MSKNKTKYKSFNRLNKDARIEEIYSDDDGFWIVLADGYNMDDCSVIHEDSVVAALNQVKYIKKGEPQ